MPRKQAEKPEVEAEEQTQHTDDGTPVPPAAEWQPYPNLAGEAKADMVSTVSSSKSSFKASYINWARTMHMLHVEAPGWLPEMLPAPDGQFVHRAPVGGYLMLRFKHADGRATPWVPQAIMDNNNNSIAWDKISARDVTDTQRRGLCMIAAQQFGLAYELWAKVELESGYGEEEQKPETKAEDRLSVEAHIAAINSAPDIPALQKAFALAWHQYRGEDDTQAMFKSEYEGRKIDLTEST